MKEVSPNSGKMDDPETEQTSLIVIIRLPYCVKASSEGFNAMLNGCSNLTALDLSNSTFTDENFRVLLAVCTKLKDLVLSECARLTSIRHEPKVGELASIATLSSLALNETGILDHGMKDIGKIFPNLRNLDVSETSLTDISFVDGISECHQLTTVDCSSTRVTDSGIRALSYG